MIKKIFFNQTLQFFLKGDFNQHNGSCIGENEVDCFPNSYNENNTKIQQIWWDKTDIDYENIGNILAIDVRSISAILQPPGNIVTMHKDSFFKFNQLYPNDTRLKVRANIYLEDWKPGHFLNYQDENYVWQTSTHWKAGDGFLWDSDNLHLSANAGLEPKFTLQISGFFKE